MTGFYLYKLATGGNHLPASWEWPVHWKLYVACVAEEFRKLGNYTCCAIITLISIRLPISLLWTFSDKILFLFSQDPEISHSLMCSYFFSFFHFFPVIIGISEGLIKDIGSTRFKIGMDFRTITTE